MPKIKTHKATSKRVKITKTGKVKRRHSFISHLKEKKSSKLKRIGRKPDNVSSAIAKKVKKLLGK